MALDNDTILLIVLLSLLLIIVIVVLILTRKFSKKALRPWLAKRGKTSYESDKAYNSLVAIRAISKNFEGQGMDVSEVKKLIVQAEGAMELKDFSSALEICERAKERLREIKSTKDQKEEAAGRKVYVPKTEELDSTADKSYQPTPKEMLQKKYPPNFVEAKFTMGLSEKLLNDSKNKGVTSSEAESILEKSKRCFESEDYEGALRFSLECKRILESGQLERIEVKPEPEKLEPEEIPALECQRCKKIATRGDVFCRRCGNKLKE